MYPENVKIFFSQTCRSPWRAHCSFGVLLVVGVIAFVTLDVTTLLPSDLSTVDALDASADADPPASSQEHVGKSFAGPPQRELKDTEGAVNEASRTVDGVHTRRDSTTSSIVNPDQSRNTRNADASGISSSQSADAVRDLPNCRPALKVYMYDLPRKFNFGLLTNEGDMVPPRGDTVWSSPAPPLHASSRTQHAVSYFMMADLLDQDKVLLQTPLCSLSPVATPVDVTTSVGCDADT